MLYIEALKLKKAELEERRNKLVANTAYVREKTEAEIKALYENIEAKVSYWRADADARIEADNALVAKLDEKIAKIDELIADEIEHTEAVKADATPVETAPEVVQEESVPVPTEEVEPVEDEPIVVRYGIGGK